MIRIAWFTFTMLAFIIGTSPTFAADLDQSRCAVSVDVQQERDGSYTLTAKAIGQAPFKYEWTNGETTEKISVKKEGQYCVTILDANDCRSRNCGTVGSTGGGDSCAVKIIPRRTGAGFTLVAQVRPANQKVKYEWSTGETTETIDVTKEGKYCVTITDADGCMARDCFEVVLNPNSRCAVRIQKTQTVNGDVVLTAFPVGAAPFTFEWTTGETSQRILAPKEGEYCVTIKDSTGCTSKACIKVEEKKTRDCAVRIAVTKRDSSGVLVLTAQAKGTAPFKYEWSNGATTESIRVDSAGKYCVTITDDAGCVSRDCFEYRGVVNKKCKVAIKSMRTAAGMVLAAYPKGGQAPYTFEWSTGETTQRIIAATEGLYCVTITSADGCQARACFKFRKPKNDTCGVRIERKIIDRAGVALLSAKAFGTPRFKYEWDNGETTPQIKVDESGTYCVKVTDSEGCEAKACIDVRLITGGGPNGYRVFPNPVIDVLNIAWTTDQAVTVDYVLADVNGNVFQKGSWTEKGTVQKRLDVSGLRPGGYVLTLTTASGVNSYRIFKR